MSDPAFSVDEITIASVHDAYLGGATSAREVVAAYLDRIESLDRSGPELNSVLAVNDAAMQEAERLDAQLAATGTLAGPLHGIPVALKDQIETAGIETTYGSVTARGNIPTTDSTVAARLRAAGAILLAKTTLPDFATSWHSTSSVSGITRNPYALDRDPGGSSSGTAAAVAANLAAVGIGEDTGGSIRLPASFCNLVGLRVRPGLISRAGLSPLVVPQDTAGPMTRTVADAAVLLEVLAGIDGQDSYTATAAIAAGMHGDPMDLGSPGYSAGLADASIAGRRLGVLRQGLGPQGDPESDAVREVFEACLDRLRADGAELVEVSIPDLDHFVAYTSVYFSRSRADLDAFIASRPGIDAASIAEIHAAGRFHPNLDLLAGIATGPATPTQDPDYHDRLQARETFQRLVVGIMADARVSALVFPDARIAAPTTADVLAARWTCLEFPTNTVIASQLWMPAITVPAGFTAAGLPVGVELMALPYAEHGLLRLAAAVERTVAGRRSPALSRPTLVAAP